MSLILLLLITTVSSLLAYFTYKEKTDIKLENLTSDLSKENEDRMNFELKYNNLLAELKKQDDLKKSKDLDEMQLLFTKVNMLDDKITFYNSNIKNKFEVLNDTIEEKLTNFETKLDEKTIQIENSALEKISDIRTMLEDNFSDFKDYVSNINKISQGEKDDEEKINDYDDYNFQNSDENQQESINDDFLEDEDLSEINDNTENDEIGDLDDNIQDSKYNYNSDVDYSVDNTDNFSLATDKIPENEQFDSTENKNIESEKNDKQLEYYEDNDTVEDEDEGDDYNDDTEEYNEDYEDGKDNVIEKLDNKEINKYTDEEHSEVYNSSIDDKTTHKQILHQTSDTTGKGDILGDPNVLDTGVIDNVTTDEIASDTFYKSIEKDLNKAQTETKSNSYSKTDDTPFTTGHKDDVQDTVSAVQDDELEKALKELNNINLNTDSTIGNLSDDKDTEDLNQNNQFKDTDYNKQSYIEKEDGHDNKKVSSEDFNIDNFLNKSSLENDNKELKEKDDNVTTENDVGFDIKESLDRLKAQLEDNKTDKGE